MPTNQAIIDDIRLRYRNSFTTDQILVWYNEEQTELFDVLELDSPPLTFQTVEGENFYPFPTDFDVSKIKTVTYQNSEPDAAESEFIEVPFMRNDDGQTAPSSPWYTVISDAMYFYVPDTVPDNRSVYIYIDSYPDQVTSANLSSTLALPTKYQELLKLGVLKRIAMARKDAGMKNNYESDYEQKLADVLWSRRLAEPEFIQPVNGNFTVQGW